MSVIPDLSGGSLRRLLNTINAMVMEQSGLLKGHGEVQKMFCQGVVKEFVKKMLSVKTIWSKAILHELVVRRNTQQISDKELASKLCSILESGGLSLSKCSTGTLSITMFVGLNEAAASGFLERYPDGFGPWVRKRSEALRTIAFIVRSQQVRLCSDHGEDLVNFVVAVGEMCDAGKCDLFIVDCSGGHMQETYSLADMRQVSETPKSQSSFASSDESVARYECANTCIWKARQAEKAFLESNTAKCCNLSTWLNCVTMPVMAAHAFFQSRPMCISSKVAGNARASGLVDQATSAVEGEVNRSDSLVRKCVDTSSGVEQDDECEQYEDASSTFDSSEEGVESFDEQGDADEDDSENVDDATSALKCKEEDSGEDFDDEDNEDNDDDEEDDSDNKPEVGDDDDDAEGVEEGGDEDGGDDDAGDDEGAEEEGGDDEGADEEGGDDDGAEEEGGDEDADDDEGEDEEEGEGEDDDDEAEDSDEGEAEGAGEGGGEAAAEVEGEGEDDVDDREDDGDEDEDEEDEEDGDEDGEEEPEEFEEEDDGDEDGDGDEQDIEDDEEQDIEDEDDEDEAEESDEDVEPPKKKRK